MDIVSILKFSKRTVSKILVRANAKCSLCGWNEANCDIHHIVPTYLGGTDEMNNLICVCPNCHRKLHQYKEKFKTKEELKLVSLEKTLPNWLDYYKTRKCSLSRICNNNNLEYFLKECKTCKKKIEYHLTYCSDTCYIKDKQKFQVSKEELEHLLKEMPIVKIAKKFKVTDNSIRNRCKKLNITIPKYPVGYWLRKQ